MSFQVKKFDSIVASMLNWLSSTTDKITDFNIGSVSRTLLESVAIELEELYYQLLKAVEEAIEESIYRAFNFPRNPAERATGAITFTRLTGSETTITVPLRTLVSTDSSPPIYFETLSEITLPVLPGTAESGGPTTLVDSTKNFVDLGVTAGSVVKNLTDGGEATVQGLSITGTATGGSPIKLIDTSKDFVALGVISGSIVTNLTDGLTLVVASISTTTNPNDTLDFSGGSTFVATDMYTVLVPYVSSSLYGINDTLYFTSLTNGASFSADVPKVFFSPLVRGVATGGSATTLIDTTKNFTALGIGLGTQITNITDGGILTVVSVSTTTTTNDTINFSSGSTFGSGDVYEANVPEPQDYTAQALLPDDIYFPVGLRIGDYLYIGFSSPTGLLTFFKGNGAAQTSTGALMGEYWNGSAWATLLYFDDQTKGVNIPFSTDGEITWQVPTDWARLVYQSNNLYWMRIKSSLNLFWVPPIRGTATGGSATKLIDTTKNFTVLGVVAGSTVTNVTLTETFTVTSISTTTNPNDTLNFLAGATIFVVTNEYLVETMSQGDSLEISKDSYKVIVMSNSVSAQAIEAGISGNVAANAIILLRSSISGLNSVNNDATFSSGREIETDSARKARFSYYIQSLARATKGALEYAAKTVSQVVAAKAIDDNRPTVLVYDADSTIDPTLHYTDITTSMRNPGDPAVKLFPSTDLQDNAIYFGGREIFDYLNLHMVQLATVAANDFVWEYWDGLIAGGSWVVLPSLTDGTNAGTGPLTQNGAVSWIFGPTNYWAAAYPTADGTVGPTPADKVRMWIRLRITSSGAKFSTPKPTGDYCSLPPGLGYVYLYAHDGSGTLPTAVKTSVESAVELYRGAGITVLVREPYLVQPAVNVTIMVAANYDAVEIGSKVTQFIIDFLSQKVLGEDLYVAEIYHKIMGMNEKAIHNCIVILPTMDLIVQSSAVIRPDTSFITVNTILE